MGIAFDSKRDSNYLGRFDRTNQADMMELNIAKKIVKHFNKDQRNNKSSFVWCIECRVQSFWLGTKHV